MENTVTVKRDLMSESMTILKQVSLRAKMELGLKNCAYDSNKNRPNLTFKCSGANIWATIELNDSDLYDVTFTKFGRGLKAIENKKTRTIKDIFVEDLSEILAQEFLYIYNF